MSAPAQNAPPAPVRMMARIAGSPPSRWNRQPSSRHMASVIALRRAARLIVTTATAALRRSTTMSVGDNWMADGMVAPGMRQSRLLGGLRMAVTLLRHLGQLDHEAARRFRIEEHDATIAMADHGLLGLESHAFAPQLTHCRIDVLDLEADVEEPFAALCDPAAGAGLGPIRLQELQIGLTDRIHGEARRMLGQVLLVLHGNAELLLEHVFQHLHVLAGYGDMLHALDLHIRAPDMPNVCRA